MAISDEKRKEYAQRLMLSRMRLMCNHGFFGLLLMHMRFGVDDETETAYTDGDRIVFGSAFLDELSNSELDFVMMHEVMHVILKHCRRGHEYDQYLFNIACDIVVNSNILLENGMRKDSITLLKYGESMHLAPNGKEGHEYTAEEVYEMLQPRKGLKPPKGMDGQWDDHSMWDGDGESHSSLNEWDKRIRDAAEAMKTRDPSNSQGSLPKLAERLLGELKGAQTDWRTILSEFVHEEVVDYTLSPPDKRFEGDFFLPDFNETDCVVEDVLFMIDTSGSMTNEMLNVAYSEIKGAIEQFDGRLRGWLGFFDAEVAEPVPFDSVEELKAIRPKGGGGTRFDIIFKYVREKMDNLPASIVILTDGEASFPEERCAMGIPTLWLINNEMVDPPWGRVARVKV